MSKLKDKIKGTTDHVQRMNSDIYSTVSYGSSDAFNPFRTAIKVYEPQVQAVEEQQDEEDEEGRLSNVTR